MKTYTAAALAPPNIAFIKYWGNRDDRLRLPVNGSLSMNLDGLWARTRVTFSPDLETDRLRLNGKTQSGPALVRVSQVLDVVRERAGLPWAATVESENNFPAGVGIASSAAAFAALATAAAAAAGLSLDEAALSRLARRGSGSAARSVPDGFVEWLAGETDETSYAVSLAGPEHWALADCVAVVDTEHKRVGSSDGHRLAASSPLQAARVHDAPRRIARCRQAILERDFEALAAVVELDSNLMHAVMMTSSPALFYWQPATLRVMEAVRRWRGQGLPVCYTIDAGPNVHVLCPAEVQPQVEARLQALEGVQSVISARAGRGARLLGEENV